MGEASLRPVPGHPLLELNADRPGSRRTLVLADLHLGLSAAESRPEAEAARLVDSLLSTGRAVGAGNYLFLGDIKHPIVGTPRPLRSVIFDFFSTLLTAGFGAEVVLGNHDVGLVPHLPREVVVHPAGGTVRDGVGLFHGHRWPAGELRSASRLVVGHLHPGFRLAPTLESTASKLPCWVRTTYGTGPATTLPGFATKELIVIPAFNPLCATEALNREKPARGRSFLFHRFLEPGASRAYLLDGTDLGPVLTTLRSARPASPVAPARQGRSRARGSAYRNRPGRARRKLRTSR